MTISEWKCSDPPMPANSVQYAIWHSGASTFELYQHTPGAEYNIGDILDYTCKPGYTMADGSGEEADGFKWFKYRCNATFQWEVQPASFVPQCSASRVLSLTSLRIPPKLKTVFIAKYCPVADIPAVPMYAYRTRELRAARK